MANTTFALILTAAIRENYGAHDWDGKGACPQYWKNKGSIEVVVREGLSVADVMGMGAAKLRELAEAAMPESDDYYAYYGMDYELVELTDELVSNVKAYVESDEFGYAHDYYAFVDVAYELRITEYAAKWAIDKLGLKFGRSAA